MNARTTFRILLDIALLVSVVYGLWLLALILGLIGLWLFPYFVESIIAGLAYDSLFGMSRGMGVWTYVGTIVSVICFGIISFIKRFLRR